MACIYLNGAQPSPAISAEETVKAWESELLALLAAGQHEAVRVTLWGLDSFNGFAQIALSGAHHPSTAILPQISLGDTARLPRWPRVLFRLLKRDNVCLEERLDAAAGQGEMK